MAVEPLGSIMSMQAQGYTQSKPVISQEAVNVAEAQPVEPVVKAEPIQKSTTQDKEMGASQQEQQQAATDQIRKAVEQLNKNMKNSEAIFGIHEETNRVTIKIVDKETKEVIKEVPPEKTLDMIAKVWEVAGILVDEKR